MRFLFTFCSIFAASLLTAQLSPLSPDFTTYVFGDKVNIRSEAQADGKVVAQLNGGESVTILEVSEKTYTASGVTLPWYKVRFNKNQTGYVWGGLLSYVGEATANGVRFAVGVASGKPKKEDEENTEYSIETRAFSASGALLSKTAQTFSAGMGYYIGADPVYSDALGLKGYVSLIKSHIGYDACGYPGYDWYVLWDGKKLVQLPVCTSIADGGVFYHTERYVFPKGENEEDQGHFVGEDKVLFKVEHGETQYIGDDESAGWNEESYVRVRPVKWDGGKFVQPKVDK